MTPKPHIQMPPRDLSQRPEVHRNVWYATVSRMEDAGEHWKRRRQREPIGIVGRRHWSDVITLRRVLIALVVSASLSMICGMLFSVCR